jgi:NADPH2:quinone reductase
MELVLHEGAHYALDHRAPDHFEKALALTDGRGVDVVLEMLANVNLGKDLKILAPGGRVVVVGSRGQIEIDPRDAMIHDAAVLGMLLFNIPERELKGIHCALFSGLENGVLRPVIGKELPLAEAPKAHEDVLKSNAYGKMVLIP